MTKDECITAIAEMIAGLQVPVSLQSPRHRVHVFGVAYEPWERLHAGLTGFGWTNAEAVETRLREILA